MRNTFGRYGQHLLYSVRTALFGPQIIAFVPAVTLGGYWFGGEGLLLFMAIFLPALFGLVSIFTPMRPVAARKGPVDPITHLPFRETIVRALDDGFAEESETGLRTAAMVLEIDDFAQIRNQYGDELAEQILGIVARRVQKTLRGGDTLSRQIDSAFAIGLSPARRVDLETMIQISARIQASIAEAITIDAVRLYLTACVGFCAPRRASEKVGEACLEQAEAALAEAQSCGHGSIRASTSLQPRKRVSRTGLVGEVTEALEGGQIKPWYQPQVSTNTGEVTGLEALARWEHPTRGLILPGAFLPAVSAAGATTQLSEVILSAALKDLRELEASGHNVPAVGVNFASEELSDPKLGDRIRFELDRHNLDPKRLTIEVLETVISKSATDAITQNLTRLAEFGCSIDLDDFGTGHASIANIRRFAVSRIKIDRSFISGVDQDRQQQQLVAAILEMAERLNVDTLAEGVETMGEHNLLAQLGCNHVQGFSVAKPMSFEATQNWLTEYVNEQPKPAQLLRRSN